MTLVARATGVFPVIAAVAAAAALTSAAVFTVAKADCPEPGHFANTDGQIQLVGGCLRRDELPPAVSQPAAQPADGHTGLPPEARR